MKNETTHYRRYLFIYLITLGTLSLPLILNFIFVRNAGENLPYTTIVRLQQSENAIYGPAFSGTGMRYKFELMRQRKPDILFVGASRVMQYRQESFRSSFVNGAGSMNFLNEGLIFLKAAFKVHKPKVLFLGLEFFWFNDNFPQPAAYESHAADETQVTRDKLLLPLYHLFQGKIRLRDYLGVLAGRPPVPEVFGNPFYGISAQASSRGTLPDGSLVYSSLYTGLEKSDDIRFAGVLNRINTGAVRFEYGSEVSKSRWRLFEEIVELCKANNVKLITILSPLAPTVLRAMNAKKSEYAFIDRLDEALKIRKDFEYYDFRDATAFGSNDCEFVDGFHPGQISSFRILLALVQRNPASVLAADIRTEFLKTEIGKYSGRTLWPGGLLLRFEHEADFLELGCSK